MIHQSDDLLPLQSLEIEKLTEAWTLAIQQIPAFEGDNASRFGKEKFVSIAQMKHVAWNILARHGIKIRQGRTKHDGHWIMFTEVRHSSGQWERSYSPQEKDANSKNGVDQTWGAAFSYQRRYELYGLFGIKGEDLDPDSAESVLEETKSYKPKNDVFDKTIDQQENPKDDSKFDNNPMAPWQPDKLIKAITSRSPNPAEAAIKYCERFNVSSLTELKQLQYKEIMNELGAKP